MSEHKKSFIIKSTRNQHEKKKKMRSQNRATLSRVVGWLRLADRYKNQDKNGNIFILSKIKRVCVCLVGGARLPFR